MMMTCRMSIFLSADVPIRSKPIPPAGAPLAITIQRAFEMTPDTAPFDVTSHPAMSVPRGMREDLPVGMMLVDKH